MQHFSTMKSEDEQQFIITIKYANNILLSYMKSIVCFTYGKYIDDYITKEQRKSNISLQPIK